ncbi:hypothetical protein BASA50_004739 [Batrachochytrium salamandrivorans]|uniref:Protein kinase domain-containing protein n=1 Tax=Batrachochytrium salamandrivorans TaxID=1357716 RepID=A0ABQ8FHM4_9FUNG|nr:hypothetical protein BASA50_004739 [Batrachochytrium salamandrivorans]KAH9273476.1 hypothetical protein BASA83_004142 [Batrachochytrium salamandrivorans]
MSRRKLSASQQNDLLTFLSSASVPSVGNYTLSKTIGQGSFGKVKLGYHKLTGQQVAVKIVDKIHAPALVREIETWRQMRHPNIAQLYEVLCTESKIYMVMEYCNGGEVFEYIVKHGRLDDTKLECRRIFRQIVDAVAKCHEKNFVHRDLKLENVLMTDDLNIKLIDFGFTRDYEGSTLLDTYCGSSAYAAPEIVSGKKYLGPEADIWSLGVILFTILCGYLPFDEENDAIIHKKITELDYELPDFLSNESKDLISKFLIISPANRITISDVLLHPWFNAVDSETPSVALTDEPYLSGSKEEMLLAAQLEALGFDIRAILESVHTNMCDQASALWYLLLTRNKSDMSSSRSNSIISPCFSPVSDLLGPNSALDTESTNFDPQNMSGSTTPKDRIGPPVMLPLNVNIEKYFTHARRISSQSENPLLNFANTTSSSVSPLPFSMSFPVLAPPTIAPRGRRGVMLNTMRTNTPTRGGSTAAEIIEESDLRDSVGIAEPSGRIMHTTKRYGVGVVHAGSVRRHAAMSGTPPTSAPPSARSAGFPAGRGSANIEEESEPDDPFDT